MLQAILEYESYKKKAVPKNRLDWFCPAGL